MVRLPLAGADEDRWGALLNEFLRVAHRDDGTVRGVATAISVKDYGAIGNGLADDRPTVLRRRRPQTRSAQPFTFHLASTALVVQPP
jgi:hypothetical protein